MKSNIEKLIEIVHKMPENCVEEAIKVLEKLLEENEEETEERVECPHCKRKMVYKNGTKDGKQRYICTSCGKSFGKTQGTVMYNSHCGEAVWKQIIEDTIRGRAIEETAVNLDLSHHHVFSMRHKILFALEEHAKATPAVLNGVCELDETFVLESCKGTEFDSEFWRKPRRHGAVAQSSGISEEYICICTGVQRDGKAVVKAVNRATPSKDEIKEVFADTINKGSLVLSDGAKSYGVLRDEIGCEVVNASKEKDSFFNINSVNSLHAFIKNKYNQYRGVATKYLNRYLALFNLLFRADDDIVVFIYSLLLSNHSANYHTNSSVKYDNLLQI